MWPFTKTKSVYEIIGVTSEEIKRTREKIEEYRIRRIVRDEVQKLNAATLEELIDRKVQHAIGGKKDA